jgi:hypothetical protein
VLQIIGGAALSPRPVIAPAAEGQQPAAAAPQLRERIEKLIQGAPVSTRIAELEIYEKVPGVAGEYRIRADVARRGIRPGNGTRGARACDIFSARSKVTQLKSSVSQ